MQGIDLNNITTDELSLPVLDEKKIQLSVLRLDQIHPLVSGNKWFKLKFYLDNARETGHHTILTFGGAWSNHILATAAICRLNGLKAIGIIRGEEAPVPSFTLQATRELGMKLVFVSREDYRLKKIPAAIIDEKYYLVNEGGYGIPGAQGAAHILDHCRKETFTDICCACGTGTMLAGLLNNAAANNTVTGISVLKNDHSLESSVNKLLTDDQKKPVLVHDYHFGGYAAHTPALLAFMNEFYLQTKVPTDFVYTAKLFFAVLDLVKKDHFPSGSKLLVIHSGGLQGNNSLGKGTLIF